MQYLLLIYNDSEKLKSFTKAEHEAFGKDYGAFNAHVQASGSLRGTATYPAGITTLRVSEGKTLSTDGPYAEAREGVGGFCLIDVPDLDAAMKIAERIPSARAGAVEIRPVAPPPSK